jgi:hypothetical protein
MKPSITIDDCDGNLFFIESKARRALRAKGLNKEVAAMEKAIEATRCKGTVNHRAAIIDAIRKFVELEGLE